MPNSDQFVSGDPRLLVINNMPAFYRSALFAELIEQFSAATGGVGMVAYQVRRDPSGRGEWFYTPDDEMPFVHHFASCETRASSRRTGYPISFALPLWFRYRPTHIFAAGWDSPLSLAAACWARGTQAKFGTWVESNPTTSKQTTRAADLYRRAFLRSADFVVVPSAASRNYVESLAEQRVRTVQLMNSVSVERISGRPARGEDQRRLVFLGDLCRRKGFDVFQEVARHLAAEGWRAIAWGRDTERLADRESCVEVREPQPLRDIVPALYATDILVIPSRADPAPLTFSEALALGLRVVISDGVAYAAEAPRIAGVEAARSESSESMVAAVRRAYSAPRPDSAVSLEVNHAHFARHVVGALLGAQHGSGAGDDNHCY